MVRDPRLRAVAAAVRATDPDLVTFDVFDTLVFRKVDRPVDAFAMVGAALRERGLLSSRVTPALFGSLRQKSEQLARQRRAVIDRSGETDLPGIYEAFPRWPLEAGATIDALTSTEVEVERRLLVPDLDVVAFLEGLKAEGRPIAAVSDIYFREPMLRDLLLIPRLIGLLQDIPFFVSCELGLGKGSGLWTRTEELLGVAPGRIVHFGDNPVDDVEKALAAGVVAVPFPQRDGALAEVAASERRLRDTVGRPAPLEWRNTVEPAGLHAMRGKVAAQGDATAMPRHAYWRYGATVLGPVLSGFAQWVARDAADAGMARVGCLMREGTLLSELITAAAAAEGVHLEAVPTWLNRHVGLAATLGTSTDPVERLLHGRTGLTVAEGLDLLGLRLEDVPELAGQAQTRLYDPTVRTALERALVARPALRERSTAHARRIAGRVAQALERAADPSGRLWLVDLGWGASIQADAVELLARHGSELSVSGLYLVTNDSALERGAAGLEIRSFLLDSGSPGSVVNLIMRSPEVIEQVTCAAIGTQRGLDEDLRPITAELDPRTDEQRRDAEAVRDGVRAFHEAWTTYRAVVPDVLPSLADAQAELIPILLRSTIAPTGEEARLFGDWHHDEGRGSASEDPLASVDHERLATHASGDQLQALAMQDLYWPAGLVARYQPDHAPLLAAAAAGLVPWRALSTDVGYASVRLLDGAATADPEGPELVALRSSQRGNVLLSWTGGGTDLQGLVLQLALEAHVLRLDSLELKLWEQGTSQPRTVRLAADDLVLQVPRERYVTVGHNVFAARAAGATISVDLLALRRQPVSRVQLLARYGLLEIPGPLGGDVPFETEELARVRGQMRHLQDSLSWRVTRPLRAAKGAARRLR